MGGLKDLDYNLKIKPKKIKVASGEEADRVLSKTMAPVKVKLNTLLRDLEPIPFTEDEHVRDHWTLPRMFLRGMFETTKCKDAGLRVALNLAECFNLGTVTWSGGSSLDNEFTLKIEVEPGLLSATIWAATNGLKAMYEAFKIEFGNGEVERVT